MIEREILLLTANAQQKQITVKNLVEKETRVYTDARMIDTVLRNLLSNALKFTDAGGEVILSSELRENFIEIAVTDTGVGMSPEEVATLFRIDVKRSTLGTAGEQGTGLGLIVCQELVEQNGGNIWVESSPGKGSSFFFSLPNQFPE